MKLLTFTEAVDHTEFALRAAMVIQFVFAAAFMLEYFDSGRESEE